MRSGMIALAGCVIATLVVGSGCGSRQQSGGAGPGAPADTLSGEITVVGSTTVQPLAERLATAFEQLHPGAVITVQGGGSSVGVTSAGEGTADLGAASRDIAPSEFNQYDDLVVYTIARDGIAVVANPDVPVSDLTLEQVRGIFSGSVTKWSDVGGPDEDVVVVSREEGSGTRAAFQELVMGDSLQIAGSAILQPSNGALLTTVSGTPWSIGFLSFGYLDQTVKAMSIGGVAPTAENASSGAYPVVRPLNLVSKGDAQGLASAWIDFIYSAGGQAIVTEEGYLPVD